MRNGKRLGSLTRLLSLVCLLAASVAAQQAEGGASSAVAAKSERVLGTMRELKIIDEQFALVIETDAGETVTVRTKALTSYRRVVPGAQTLEGAEKSSATELKAGDRVLVLGVRSADAAQTVHARAVVLMKAADVSAKRASESKQWETNGVMGVVETFPAAGQIAVRVPGRKERLQVVVTPRTGLRRMSTGSLKYEGARAGKIEEIKVGDRFRARGTLASDGLRFMADEVITGTLLTLFAKVTGVSSGGSELEVEAVEGGERYTVVLTGETKLRAFPKDLAALFSGGGRPQGADADGMTEARREDLKAGMVISVTAVVEGAGGERRLTAAQVMTNMEMVAPCTKLGSSLCIIITH